MSSKKRKALNGALLTAAVTTLTVKGALASPLGPAMEPQVDDLEKSLARVKDSAVTTSGPLLERAQTQLQDAALTVGGGTPATSLPLSGPRQPLSSAAGPATGRGLESQRISDGLERAYRTNFRPRVLNILKDAAVRHGVDPKLALAVSFWESGWNQSKVSETGAVGLMQVEPETAQAAGPALLGRTVNINDAYDNADVGVAVLREDLDNFKTPAMALAAYYQGPTSLQENGMLPDTQQYVEGILDLAARMSS